MRSLAIFYLCLVLLGASRRVAYDIVGTHPPTADRVAFLRRLVEANRRTAGN